MSHWNHRVVKRVYKMGDYEETSYGVHEAYYDDNNKVNMITEEPVGPHGETMKELRQCLEWMTKALEHPILDYDKIPEEGAKSAWPEDQCI